MDNNQSSNKLIKFIKDMAPMAVGEVAVILATMIGAGILHLLDVYTFNFSILTGVLLGAVIAISNFAFLTISVDRAINDFIALRGDKEMDEEEAAAFAKKNAASMQNAIKTSFIIRTASMAVALVVAFITTWFNPLATAIPMFAFRPLLTVADALMKKNDKKPDTSKFIKYDFDDEKKEGEQ